MEASITPARIVNAIMQDKSFEGYYLFVEGKKDIPVYRKFVNSDVVKLRPTFGKYKMRTVFSDLNNKGYDKKFAIRDADFIRLREKFCGEYEEDIFITDCHDSEVMMIDRSCLDDFLYAISDEYKIKAFQDKYGDIRNLIYSLAYPIGCLRFANKVYSLGLSFKPEKPEGNKFKMRDIISDKDFSFRGDEQLVSTIFNYSINREGVTSDREFILDKLKHVSDKKLPLLDIVNGHDLTEILLIICKKGLKSTNKAIVDSGCIENMLALSFHYSHFKSTDLYKMLENFNNKLGNNILENSG